jgi:uncharacterized OB-fold protein
MGSAEGLPEAPGVAFQRYLKEGQLWLQNCDDCARQVFYPRTLCPHCGGTRLTWRRASGDGTVYSTTIVRQRPDRGGDYNVAIVELAEGARLLSRVEGVAPEEVRIGMAVRAVIRPAAEAHLVVFEKAGGAAP